VERLKFGVGCDQPRFQRDFDPPPQKFRRRAREAERGVKEFGPHNHSQPFGFAVVAAVIDGVVRHSPHFHSDVRPQAVAV